MVPNIFFANAEEEEELVGECVHGQGHDVQAGQVSQLGKGEVSSYRCDKTQS